MIFRKQLFRHKPDEGIYGDCHRTAIACLLDLEPEEIPNFGELHWNDPSGFHNAVDECLESRGLAIVSAAYEYDLAQLLEYLEIINPGVCYLLGGTSRTGVGHTVIGCGGEIIWDPSLDDAGIVEPMEGGLYWVSYLVPSFLKKTDGESEKHDMANFETIQNQPAGLNPAETLFGFCAWLTTRPDKTVLSASDDCAPIVKLIKKFCEKNRLSEPRPGWENNLIHPSSECSDPAP